MLILPFAVLTFGMCKMDGNMVAKAGMERFSFIFRHGWRFDPAVV